MLKARGKLLATSVEDRQLRYRLLPFGEPGSTNKGRVLASAGAVEVPEESLPVNLEHDHTRPLGRMTVAEDADGLEATVDVARTRAGDDVLEEAAQGLRAGISVEIDNPVIRAGRLIAGKLSGAGLVVKPAYPSALLMAADFGGKPEDEDDEEADDDADKPAVTNAEAQEATEQLDVARAAIDAGDLAAAAAAIAAAQEEIATTNESEKPAVPVTASAPASPQALLAAMAAAMGTPADALTAAKPEDALTLGKFAATFRSISGQDSRMTAAALDTITQADMYDPTAQPAYLGELWNNTVYTERFAPLVSHENLTGMSVKGWRWVAGKSPIVDDWEPPFSGVAPLDHMNEIPTGEVVAEADEWFAKRIAGGNRFDRVHIDFPVPGVLESFLREQSEYIKKRRDTRVKEHLIGQAKPVVGTGNDVANAWRRIILGAMHVLDYSKPTYAIVGNDLYRELLGTDMLENLAMLDTTLGLESGSMAGFRIQPAGITDTAMSGKVYVGAANATVLHEPGGAPIRVDAQELAVGAVDKAVFSYYLLRSDDRGGIVEVTA